MSNKMFFNACKQLTHKKAIEITLQKQTSQNEPHFMPRKPFKKFMDLVVRQVCEL